MCQLLGKWPCGHGYGPAGMSVSSYSAGRNGVPSELVITSLVVWRMAGREPHRKQ